MVGGPLGGVAGQGGARGPQAFTEATHLPNGIVHLLQLLVAISGLPQRLQHELLNHGEELREKMAVNRLSSSREAHRGKPAALET